MVGERGHRELQRRRPREQRALVEPVLVDEPEAAPEHAAVDERAGRVAHARAEYRMIERRGFERRGARSARERTPRVLRELLLQAPYREADLLPRAPAHRTREAPMTRRPILREDVEHRVGGCVVDLAGAGELRRLRRDRQVEIERLVGDELVQVERAVHLGAEHARGIVRRLPEHRRRLQRARRVDDAVEAPKRARVASSARASWPRSEASASKIATSAPRDLSSSTAASARPTRSSRFASSGHASSGGGVQRAVSASRARQRS